MKWVTLYIVLLCTAIKGTAQCITSSPQNPSTFSNNASIGTLAWTNTSNAQTSDDNYASAGQTVGVLSTVTTQYLVVSNFGFTIPAGSTICGIFVEVEKSGTGILVGSSIKDNSVRLVKTGSIIGADYASPASWSGTDAYAAYGSNTDLWSTTWSAAEVNASTFGVAFSVKLSAGLAALFLTAQVDHVRVTISYATPVPVLLRSFTAVQMGPAIRLDWVTGTEVSNKAFFVHRSADNTAWMILDSIPGAGNASEDRYYSYTDYHPGGINFYRLNQVDWDGRSMYSKIIRVTYLINATPSLLVFPNPVSRWLKVQPSAGLQQLQFFNMNSIEVFPARSDATQSPLTFDVSILPPGTYFARARYLDRIVYRAFIRLP